MPNTAMLRLEHSNFPASDHSLSRRGTNLTTFVILEGDEESDYVRGNRRSAPVPPPVPCAPSGAAAEMQRELPAALQPRQPTAATAAAEGRSCFGAALQDVACTDLALAAPDFPHLLFAADP